MLNPLKANVSKNWPNSVIFGYFRGFDIHRSHNKNKNHLNLGNRFWGRHHNDASGQIDLWEKLVSKNFSWQKFYSLGQNVSHFCRLTFLIPIFSPL